MERLRSETREQHEALERALPLGRATLSRPVYGQVLLRFWGFYATWEREALRSSPSRLIPVVAARCKLPLLVADLEAERTLTFASPAPLTVEASWLPDMSTEAGLLGSMYVIEGSTLGGQIISRHLERDLGLQAGQGYSFFQSYGRQVGQQWKEYRALVEQMPEEAGDSIVRAAQQTFAAFHRWIEAEELAWQS